MENVLLNRLPEKWISDWENPKSEQRPLQIIHGIAESKANIEGMRYYKDLGLGGIVCNVAFEDYLQSEENWNIILKGVEACDQIGLLIWIYDEEGYPSGAAGGLVLDESSKFEALELVYDQSLDDPFFIRPAYEHTHASNNYFAYRRYVNLIDKKVVSCFIKKTHEAYWNKLKPYFGKTIQSFFTDEPSLMAVNLGQLPENVRNNVRIINPLNPDILPLPCVPWSYELEDQYFLKYGKELKTNLLSLFKGNSSKDKKVRLQYWSLISELTAKNYFRQILDWCKIHKIASSGHTLFEEQIIKHIPLYGNPLKSLSEMDIPGLDMLSSEPSDVNSYAWLTAGLPTSAAILTGRRRVMTEISDFDQKMSGKGPVDLSNMKATAAWQATWGVTDFTLYYNIEDRDEKVHRSYCDFVGRLNSILKEAKPIKKVLLFYPINDLWEEHLPVAEPLLIETQTKRSQTIASSFMNLGQILQQSQIPFVLIDHEYLSKASINNNGNLIIGNNSFDAILFSDESNIPDEAKSIIDSFIKSGGKVIKDSKEHPISSHESLIKLLSPEFKISPHSSQVAFGQFIRDGKQILLLVNVSEEDYQGSINSNHVTNWMLFNPDETKINQFNSDKTNCVALSLKAKESLLLIEI